MSDINSIAKDLAKIIKESDKKKTSAYDTPAQVMRIEGNTAWVHIPGGVDETPVKLTVNASVGDTVQIRVAGGRAWITGNATAPPTDDRMANTANANAKVAYNLAGEAQDAANEAYSAAESAQASAAAASTAAASAETSAGEAKTSATKAMNGLSEVEKVIDVLTWIAEHGEYALTTDAAVQEGKTYFIRSGAGTEQDPYIYTPVENPSGDPSALGYYELTGVDEAVTNYISTHLTLLDDGLYVTLDNSGYKVKITNEAVLVLNEYGSEVASLSNPIQLGEEESNKVVIDDNGFLIKDLINLMVAAITAKYQDPVILTATPMSISGDNVIWSLGSYKGTVSISVNGVIVPESDYTLRWESSARFLEAVGECFRGLDEDEDNVILTYLESGTFIGNVIFGAGNTISGNGNLVFGEGNTASGNGNLMFGEGHRARYNNTIYLGSYAGWESSENGDEILIVGNHDEQAGDSYDIIRLYPEELSFCNTYDPHAKGRISVETGDLDLVSGSDINLYPGYNTGNVASVFVNGNEVFHEGNTPTATSSKAGFMSAADKSKVDKLAFASGINSANFGSGTDTSETWLWGNDTNKVGVGAFNNTDNKRYNILARADRLRLYNTTDSSTEWDIFPITSVTGDNNGKAIASTSLASASIAPVANFTVSAGLYLVIVYVQFPSNATGRRYINLSTTSGGSSAVYDWSKDDRTAVSGGITTCRIVCTLEATARETYYINAYQNSGASLNVTGSYNVLRIG